MGPYMLSALVLLVGYVSPAHSILCYQCNSTDTMDPYQCIEFFGNDVSIEPKPCDNVYGAAYCIKHTGRYEAESIMCYQCYAPNNTDCTDMMIHDRDGSTVEPKSCDHVFEASFCIKATGINNGGVGTRRYCSSVDLGNYCDVISQSGDQRAYRSCKYTCSTDGCNGAYSPSVDLRIIALLTSLIAFANR